MSDQDCSNFPKKLTSIIHAAKSLTKAIEE